MAKQKIMKGSEEWQMFQDYWNLCQELWIPEESDDYWDKVLESVDKFYKKYGTIFAKHLSIALENTLDERWKNRGNKK